jgi:hypothetical protein
MRRRSDGTAVERLPALRRLMPFLMPRRNDAFVLFEQTIPTAPLRPLLEQLNAGRPDTDRVTLFHCVLRAIGLTLTDFPRLNRFIAGRRLWERRGIWLALSGKQCLDRDAPVFSTKIRFDPTESLTGFASRLQRTLRQGRTGDSASDKEIGLLVRLPRFVLRALTWLQPRLDACGLLPARLVDDDPLYASAFIANLGSVGLDAAYHHLFEYGTVPIFVTMGRVHRAPVVRDDGSVTSEEVFVLRYTYDERIEDGFYAARALEALAASLANPVALSGASSG